MRHGNQFRQYPKWVKPRRANFWNRYNGHIQSALFIVLFNWAWIADLKGW